MANSIQTAIFPAAGLGTRLLPATKAQPKEMLMLVDKPVIQYGIEEAARSGVNNIVIVTGRDNTIKNHFDLSPALQQALKKQGKEQPLEELNRLLGLIKVSYAQQDEPKGLGHAVLATQAFTHGEPFAVVLSDDVIDADPPVLKQLIDVYERVDGPVVAVEKVPVEEVSKYGIVAIDKADDLGPGIGRIRSLIEKPSRSSAPSNLAIIGRYILTPDIFSALESTGSDKNGEIQLTNGLKQVLRERHIYTCEIKGVRHDTGNKLGFLKAFAYFALQQPDLAVPFRKYLDSLNLDVGTRSRR